MSVKKLQCKLRRPNLLTKAMDGLFKNIGNRAWSARAFSYWGPGHLKQPVSEHVLKRKIARHA